MADVYEDENGLKTVINIITTKNTDQKYIGSLIS